jgi:hypothetical protein
MFSRTIRAAACAATLYALVACGAVRTAAEMPGRVVTGVSGAPRGVDLERVRNLALRHADRIVLQIDAATLLFTEGHPTPEAYERALVWRINAAEQAYQIAARPRPIAALADLVAFCAWQRRVHQSYWGGLWDDDTTMADTWAGLEREGLDLLDQCLPEKQARAMRTVIEDWTAMEVADPSELVGHDAPRIEDLAQGDDAREGGGSLLGIIGLDPLDSLEPAAREVARSRELAERALFLGQRMPRTLAWRSELLTLRLGQQPTTREVVDDVDRVTRAMEEAITIAGDLPTRMRAEADALLASVSAELAAQRAGIVADLERTSAPTQALLAQTEQTLDAANRLAATLDGTTRTVDAFVARVTPDDAPEEEPEPAGPPGKPFDPVEYTALATELTKALSQLDLTITDLDRNMPAVQRVLDESAARIDRSIERAYGLALRLVMIGIVAAGVVYALVRLLVRRAPANARA